MRTVNGGPAAAPVSSRIKAFALDYLVILGYLAVLTGASLAVSLGIGISTGIRDFLAQPLVADLLTFFTVLLPVVLYFTFTESSPRQASWGKRRTGIRVVDAGGSRLSRRAALVRSLVKFLPWQLAHSSIYHIPGWPLNPGEIPWYSAVGLVLTWALVIAYLLTLLLGKTHRTPYDWLAGSRVVM